MPRPADGDLAQVVRRGDRPPRCRSACLLGAVGYRCARGLRVPPVAVRAAPLLRALRRWRRFARRPAPASSTGRATVRTGNHHDHQEGLGLAHVAVTANNPPESSISYFVPKGRSTAPHGRKRPCCSLRSRAALRAAWARKRVGGVSVRRGGTGQDIAAVIDVYVTTVTTWTYQRTETETNCREQPF